MLGTKRRSILAPSPSGLRPSAGASHRTRGLEIHVRNNPSLVCRIYLVLWPTAGTQNLFSTAVYFIDFLRNCFFSPNLFPPPPNFIYDRNFFPTEVFFSRDLISARRNLFSAEILFPADFIFQSNLFSAELFNFSPAKFVFKPRFYISRNNRNCGLANM